MKAFHLLSKSNLTTTALGENVEAMVLKTGVFPAFENPSSVLFVRACTREIYEGIQRHRTNEPAGNSAVIGQPGIGKSYNLFYFAYRFLQEHDVDVVVLEQGEQGVFYIFYAADYEPSCNFPDELVNGKDNEFLVNDIQKTMIWKLFIRNERVVYLADMQDEKPSFVGRRSGYSLFSSSPHPYFLHLHRMHHKLRLEFFSPSLWEERELKPVFEYNPGDSMGSKGEKMHWKNVAPEGMKSFEQYYHTFGGTLRPIYAAEKEFIKMNSGTTKLWDLDPDKIKDATRDIITVTHALFAERGGSAAAKYRVDLPPTPREFRSKFTEFWFKRIVAPRILFYSYKADVLRVLFSTNKKANGSEHGVRFEELFHKLLPLGKWSIKDVPLKREDGVAGAVQWVGSFLGIGPTSTNPDVIVDFKDIPVVQRSEGDPVAEADLTGWPANTKDGTVKVNTADNRKDVGHLVATWNSNLESFYWIPLGGEFPGLDSVCRQGNQLYFVQVKTGKLAEEIYRWIAEAFLYTQLLLEKMGNTDDLDVTILVGGEPSSTPALGKRKRADLNKVYPEKWKIRYLPNCVKDRDETPELMLNIAKYGKLAAEFRNFVKITAGPSAAPPAPAPSPGGTVSPAPAPAPSPEETAASHAPAPVALPDSSR